MCIIFIRNDVFVVGFVMGSVSLMRLGNFKANKYLLIILVTIINLLFAPKLTAQSDITPLFSKAQIEEKLKYLETTPPLLPEKSRSVIVNRAWPFSNTVTYI